MMKRFSSLCALILLLVTSISTYAGVNADGVTAYRSAGQTHIIFTDDPRDDPNSTDAPLGTAFMSGNSCTASVGGGLIVGLVCNGTSGDPIETYTCATDNFTINTSNTTWCLFSENPRTGKKAWAVKFVNGVIPTNDGASIVRCVETYKFDSENGCRERNPSQISIEGGFIKLDTTDGYAPFDSDCSLVAHYGRMVVDDVNDILYICTDSGWISK